MMKMLLALITVVAAFTFMFSYVIISLFVFAIGGSMTIGLCAVIAVSCFVSSSILVIMFEFLGWLQKRKKD